MIMKIPNEPLVSVVIPIYDNEQGLYNCLTSVRDQTYPNIEIIIIDDGSSREVSTSIKLKNNEKIIRNNNNMGVSFSRNLGVKESNGTLICFLDSDDLFHKKKIEKQVARWSEICTTTPTVIGTSVQLRDLDKNFICYKEPIPSSKPCDFYAGVWFYPGSSLLIEKNIFETIGGFDLELKRLEDFEFFLRFSKLNGKYICVPEPLCVIFRSRHARQLDVINACTHICKKHLATAPNLVSKRNLISFLSLEIGAIFFHCGKTFASLPFLAASWLLKPRLTSSLNSWWKISEIKIEDEKKFIEESASNPK